MKNILTAIWSILLSSGEARAAAYIARSGDLKTAENMLK